MQLITSESSALRLRLGLMAASCNLLAPSAQAQSVPDPTSSGEQPLTIDSGLLFYKEDLSRIQTRA